MSELQRGTHFRAVGRSPALRISTATGLVAAAAAGVLAGSAVLTAVLAVALAIAGRRAHDAFWTRAAASFGLRYVADVELDGDTPLMAAGDRRSCPEWMGGALPDGRGFGLGNYTFEERHRDGNGNTTWTSYRFAVARVDVAAPDVAFVRGLYLRDRNRLRFLGVRTLPDVRTQRIETESAAFNERYDLYVDPADDPGRVLEILTPSFIETLTGLDVGFDYRDGMLTVFVDGHARTTAALRELERLARIVLARIDDEIAESRAARGDAGLRP